MSLLRVSSRALLTCSRRRPGCPLRRPYVTEESQTREGVTYTGTFQGTRLTEGTMALPDGRQYKGRFGLDGHLLDGGTMEFEGGTYTGQFQDWARHGRGRTEFKSGKVEEGTYNGNALTSGTSMTPLRSGGVLELAGEWRGGQLSEGTMRRPGLVYRGHFQGGQPHGEGETTFETGAKHTGLYREGRFHGKGTLVTPTGDVFSGDFEAGVLRQGTLQYMDGSRYEGHFNEAGELDGEGEYMHGPTRHTYTGHWRQGQFESGQVLDAEGFPAELVSEVLRVSDLRR